VGVGVVSGAVAVVYGDHEVALGGGVRRGVEAQGHGRKEEGSE
jgi:hypothetical protein